MKTNLKEIWQGNVMQEIRNSFLENKPKKVCQLCLENERLNL